MSGSVHLTKTTPSLFHHMPIVGKQLDRDVRAGFLGPKSHRYLGGLAGKCALMSYFADNWSEIKGVFRAWKEQVESRCFNW